METALKLFWRRGFEATSLTELTGAMGITRPSLYAAFGNKEALFRKALDHYEASYMRFAREALDAPTAHEAVRRLLEGYLDLLTATDNPPGALETNAALVCSTAAEPIREVLIASRQADERALRARLDRAHAEGDLPDDAEPAALAEFVAAVTYGMSVKAASGVGRQALRQVVDTALTAIPRAR